MVVIINQATWTIGGNPKPLDQENCQKLSRMFSYQRLFHQSMHVSAWLSLVTLFTAFFKYVWHCSMPKLGTKANGLSNVCFLWIRNVLGISNPRNLVFEIQETIIFSLTLTSITQVSLTNFSQCSLYINFNFTDFIIFR